LAADEVIGRLFGTPTAPLASAAGALAYCTSMPSTPTASFARRADTVHGGGGACRAVAAAARRAVSGIAASSEAGISLSIASIIRIISGR